MPWPTDEVVLRLLWQERVQVHERRGVLLAVQVQMLLLIWQGPHARFPGVFFHTYAQLYRNFLYKFAT